VSDIYDNAKPLILELVYDIPAGAQKVADGLAVRLPDTWEREYLGLRDMKRQEPVQVRCPLTVRSTVRITPPLGHAVVAPGPRRIEAKRVHRVLAAKVRQSKHDRTSLPAAQTRAAKHESNRVYGLFPLATAPPSRLRRGYAGQARGGERGVRGTHQV